MAYDYSEALSRNERLLMELIDKVDGGGSGGGPVMANDIDVSPEEADSIFDNAMGPDDD